MPSLRYDPRAAARRSPAANAAIGLAVLAALAAFIYVGLRAPDAIPGRKYYTVSVRLGDAGTLAPHSDVRIGGARVGQVLDPRWDHGRPTIDLQLENSVRPILSDAVVSVRPKSAIGQPYVSLFPGTRGAPIPENGWIPDHRSKTAIPLDRVLGAFDPPARARFQALMRELGNATAGRGEGGGRTIVAAPGMLRDLQTATSALARDPQALRGFVEHSADLADTFADVRRPFADMFRPAADVMGTLAGERAALRATFAEAPSALAATQGGLARLDPALTQLTRLARTALPPLHDAPGALGATASMLRTGRSSVPVLDRTLALAGRAVPPTLGLLKSARGAAPWLDGMVAGARPTVEEVAPRGRCDLVRLTRNWQNFLAFGEPKQQGGTAMDVDIATPALNFVGGDTPLNTHKVDLPVPRSPYPAPCMSYFTVQNYKHVDR